MKVKKQRQWIVIKYGIIYLCISGAIGALVIIRTYIFCPNSAQLTLASTAAILGSTMRINCGLCANI